MPTRFRPSSAERGSVALELALLLPVLLLLVLGIIQYGFYFNARQGGSDAARDAARRAAVGDPVTCTAFKSIVKNDIKSFVETPTHTVVTRTYTKQNPALVQVGDTVTIRVAFDSHDLNLPLVPFVHNGRVDFTVTARVEFVPKQPEVCS